MMSAIWVRDVGFNTESFFFWTLPSQFVKFPTGTFWFSKLDNEGAWGVGLVAGIFVDNCVRGPCFIKAALSEINKEVLIILRVIHLHCIQLKHIEMVQKRQLIFSDRFLTLVIIDREARDIMYLVASIRLSVCPFVMLSCLNCLNFDLHFWYAGWPWPNTGWDWRSRS